MKRMKQSHRAILAAVVCHVFWGVSFLASRTALNTAPVILLLSHRFLLAFLVMSLLLPLPGIDCHLLRKDLKPLLLLGLIEPVIYFFGEQYGLLHSTTSFSGVMISIIPIVSTLAAVPILGEKPTAGQLFYSVLSVLGVIGIGLLNKNSGTLDWIGVAALLVAVFSAAAYTLLNRSYTDRYSPFERTYMMLAVGALVFTALALIQVRGSSSEYLQPLHTQSYHAAVVFLAVCCSVICYFLAGYVLSNLSIARATVFANLTTAVSVLTGVLILHEPFSLTGLVCCALILFGIYGVQKTAAKESERSLSSMR